MPGGRIVYLGRNKDKWVVILDGKQGPVSDHLPVLRFTPDGRRCIYAVIVRGKQRVVIDGNPTREYEHVWEYGFAPDNRSFYIAQEKNKQFLVLAGGLTLSAAPFSATMANALPTGLKRRREMTSFCVVSSTGMSALAIARASLR